MTTKQHNVIQQLRGKALRESWALRWTAHQPFDGWHTLAECKGTDIDLWFEEVKTKNTPAKSICNLCPVKLSCGTMAWREERHEESVYGIRAGLGPKSRKEMYTWINKQPTQTSSTR